MTGAPVDDQRRSLVHWIDDTAGYGALRADALVAMLRPFGCTVRAQRGASGLRSVHIYGPTPVVDHLRDQLDGWLAALDAAAKTATRRYGAWLRQQDEPDHMPSERRNLTRAYRRQYLPAWAAGWAARLDNLISGHDNGSNEQPANAPTTGHSSAHTAAGHDIAQLDPQPLREAAAIIRANTPHRRHRQAAPGPAPTAAPAGSVRPDGPGRIAPGQRVTCLPGSLPARDGGRAGGVLVSIGPKTSLVDVYGGRRRRIPNELLHPEAGPGVAADRDARGLRTARASGRGWLPGWSWLGWTIAQHLEYRRGERHLPKPPPTPPRLVIVACGARKTARFEAPAGEMYVGNYHRAARRAADAITTMGTKVVILSARYGLLDLDDVILRYEARLGQRHAITAPGLREQAEQLGLAHTAEVIVLAPGAYADLAAHVWPHAQFPLAGTSGIGEQMARLTALATSTTITDVAAAPPSTAAPAKTLAAPTGDEHTVSSRGGLVHIAHTPPGRAGTLAPICPAHQPGRRWRLTHASITCTRCATIAARRRALHRWSAMVDRTALATEPASSRSTAPRPTGRQTGPARRRPATRSRRHGRRPPTPRRPGGTPRHGHRDGWRLVPARPPRAIPLIPTADPASRRRPYQRSPRYPRPPIGRAPPRPRRARQGRVPALRRSPADHRPDPVPQTLNKPLTSRNTATANRFANSLRRPSDCTTRPSPAGGGLADLLLPAVPPQLPHASTIRPTLAAPDRCEHTARGLDRTVEVRPMTDLTTHPVQAGTPGPTPIPVPVNGAAFGDVRSLRHVTRAEQERLSADAEVERRARAARLDLELREQRRAATRREREADATQKRARAEQRRTRRVARRARLHAAAPRWADRALFVLPIMFPMAVAWVGQIRFAMTVMGWPLPAAIVFAAGFELSTAYVARLDWLSRATGDSAVLFRGATWGFAAGAATMNYWHAAGPNLAPTGEAVSYAMMSITGVVLWELLSTYRHRTALRADGKLPAARPRFGLARWIWFNKLTRLAWLLTLRDGHTTTDLAWNAALVAANRYGSPKGARQAIGAGHPVPRAEPLGDNGERESAERRDTGHGEEQWDGDTQREDRQSTGRDGKRDSLARDEQRDGLTRPDDRDNAVRDTPQDRPNSAPRTEHLMDSGDGQPTSEPGAEVQTALVSVSEQLTAQAAACPANDDETNPVTPAATLKRGRHRGFAPREQAAEAERDLGRTGVDLPPRGRVGAQRDSGEPAASARMLAYARERLAQGTTITGADLDRMFGTRDYGRKIIRRLTAESRPESV